MFVADGGHQAEWFLAIGAQSWWRPSSRMVCSGWSTSSKMFGERRSVVVETIKQNGLSWTEYIKPWFGASGAAVLVIKSVCF
eukprot:5734530-Heterocapsa_arctica.AAC.1